MTEAPSPGSVLGLTGTHLQLSVPVDLTCANGATPRGANLLAIWNGSSDPTVTVDIWLLESDEGLLMLTTSERGNPSAATLEELYGVVVSLDLE